MKQSQQEAPAPVPRPESASTAHPSIGSRLRRALSFTRGHRWAIFATVALAVVAAAVAAAEPLVLRNLVDALSRAGARDALVTGAVTLAVMLAFREALGALGNWLGWRTRLGVQRALLDATIGRLHALPLAFHRGEGVGGTMTRLDRGVQGLASTFSEVVFNLFPALLYLAVATVLMARLHATLTLAILAVLPLPALVGVWAAGPQATRDQSLLDRWRQIYARLHEVLGGIATVKSFAMEQEEKRRFVGDVDRANAQVMRGVRFDAQITLVQNLVTGGTRVLVVGYGGWLTLRGELSVGTLLAFLGYLTGLTSPVQGLTRLYQTLRRAAVFLDAVFSILEAEDHVSDAADARDARVVGGAVEFHGVGFGYGQERPVLRDVDLTVRAGETVALVGPSGGGKTTLMSLLLRLHDPERGSIRVDGVDIRTVTQRSLRRQIGVVMQDPLLFDDTVGANIAYGRPDASPAEIEQAARAAHAHAFIQALPRGYASRVGERGALLSAGQRQRIAIARALLKDPPILVLDEATSALDAESEAEVQSALDRLLVGRTTFLVAHRLATVVKADRILVFRGGRVAESGTHAQLVRQGGYYAGLVALQTRGLVSQA
jgi:ATP-binding cassette subfamily B protein